MSHQRARYFMTQVRSTAISRRMDSNAAYEEYKSEVARDLASKLNTMSVPSTQVQLVFVDSLGKSCESQAQHFLHEALCTI